MIVPGVAAPNFAGRIGTTVVRSRGDVTYRVLRSSSLVNTCTSTNVPFRFTANPYRGCAMGCRYCYAAYTHEFIGEDGVNSFHSTIFVKDPDMRETARRLQRVVRRGEQLALGTATDPYQPGEGEFRVTRRFLELVAQHRGVHIGITTKGALILRDLDLLRKINERSRLSVQVSLISTRAELLRRIEPWAPPPEVRLDVMRRLRAAGITVGAAVAPVLPGLTDGEPDLDVLFARIAAAGVRHCWVGILFLRSPTKEKYLRWLAADFPRYLEAYKRAYETRAYLGGTYKKRIVAMTERLRARYGFESRPFAAVGSEAPLQLRLWG